ARGIELQEAVSAGVPACSCRAGPQVGPATERDRGRSRDLDRDAADVGAPGRRRRRPAGGADERGADGAARAAPEGEDARAGTRDLEKSRGLLGAGERDAVTVFRFIAAEKTNHPISLMCR